jgi:HAD superfamily hydrolase (TIGR01662 family)
MVLQKAVFLDRDGVITEVKSSRVQYVNQPGDVNLLPGAAEAIHGLRQAGFRIYIVTNQGGIGERQQAGTSGHHRRVPAGSCRKDHPRSGVRMSGCPG